MSKRVSQFQLLRGEVFGLFRYSLLPKTQALALLVVGPADFGPVQVRACPFHLSLCDLGLCRGQWEESW